eukprot:6322-Rhodomonas_salina.1
MLQTPASTARCVSTGRCMQVRRQTEFTSSEIPSTLSAWNVLWSSQQHCQSGASHRGCADKRGR